MMNEQRKKDYLPTGVYTGVVSQHIPYMGKGPRKAWFACFDHIQAKPIYKFVKIISWEEPLPDEGSIVSLKGNIVAEISKMGDRIWTELNVRAARAAELPESHNGLPMPEAPGQRPHAPPPVNSDSGGW